jgi:hypothetical protein
MRRWRCLLGAFAFLLLLGSVPALAQIITMNATPTTVHPGDTVTLNGTVTGIHTIAVYLFLTGPGLDPRGVTLENLNIPAGRGLFSTAPVNMNDGSWQYSWDTSVILGNLAPGDYTIYVETAPFDRERIGNEGYATATVTFLPPENAPTPVPLSPGIAIAAFGITVIAGSCLIRRWKTR